MSEQRPIIIKKVKKGHGGHHGGAWKLAYADFVTAMMAFFLLMWLLGSTTKGSLQGIAEYFQNPFKVAMSGGEGSGDANSVIRGGGEDLSRSVGQVKRTNEGTRQILTKASEDQAGKLRLLKDKLERMIAADGTEPRENSAIIAADARPDTSSEQPDSVEIFASVAHYGEAPRELYVTAAAVYDADLVRDDGLADARLLASQRVVVEPSSPTQLVLRAETLVLRPGHDTRPANALAATLTGRQYLGAKTLCRVALAHGPVLQVDVPGLPTHQPGDALWLQVPASSRVISQ
mgnify:CR=1 FL=1